MKDIITYLKIIILILFTSCKKEVFTTKTLSEGIQSNQVQNFIENNCADHTLIRPPVDFIFIWDNSASSNLITSQTKQQLKNILYQITDQFDYRIIVAPLYRTSEIIPIIAYDPGSLNQQSLSRVKTVDQINLFNKVQSGSVENGFSRLKELLIIEKNNNVLRENAYHISVMISNGDDNGYKTNNSNFYVSETQKNNHFNQNLVEIINIKNNLLKSKMFRFFSIVRHKQNSNCINSQGSILGLRYIKMSKQLYSFSNTNDDKSDNPDSFDLCTNTLDDVFSSINKSIEQVVIKHKYNFWSITKNNPINTNEIIVKKINSNSERDLIFNDTENGFSYKGFYLSSNKINTRFFPSDGESNYGHIIQLHGDAILEYPGCLIVKTKAPYDYFGYISISRKPDISTVKIYKDNQLIPKDNQNGWSYLGQLNRKNIKILGPNNYQEGLPPMYRSGYFFKLNGNATYSNNQYIKVNFKPAPQ